jgi:hypothetical protein
MDFVLKKLRIKLIPTNTRFITYLMMGKVDHQLLEVTYQMARRRVHHQNFGQLRKSGSKITKMRQDNLPSTDNKYAAIVITQQTYDKRALTCTDLIPLSNSLFNLSHLFVPSLLTI